MPLFDIQSNERGIGMIKKRIKSDAGLMGPTHALSAVAISFLLTWVASEFMFGRLLGSQSVVVFASAIIIIIGAALMPDLDAVQSTSISTLGFAGVLLSKGMRAFSTVVQTTIKAKGDKNNPDPHRGFWHTFLSAILVGGLVSGLTSINVEIITILGVPLTFATITVMFIIYMSIQLMMASLFKNFYRRNKKDVKGRAMLKIGSVMASAGLLYFLPPDISYSWVGAVVAFGWLLHLFGDMMTVAGVPVLFPLKYRGKRWWNFRFPFGIKAGGFIEKNILIPIFVIIIIVSSFNIIPLLI